VELPAPCVEDLDDPHFGDAIVARFEALTSLSAEREAL
jgi:hypothetical protein